MPTYSYACTACEHRFDTVQTFADPSLTDCPECAGRLRKLFTPVGVVFKGSGFYRTDSRSRPPGESGSADKTDKSKPDSTSESTPKEASGASSGSAKAAPEKSGPEKSGSRKSDGASSSSPSRSASTHS